MNTERKTDLAPLKNPPLKIIDLINKLQHGIMMAQISSGDGLMRVSHFGEKDRYVTGFSISDDKSYIRLTTSIGEVEPDAPTDEKENPSN